MHLDALLHMFVQVCKRQLLFNELMPCSFNLYNADFIASTCSMGSPCHVVILPTTLNGCLERYDIVGLPGSFLSGKSQSFSISQVGSTN